MQFYSFSNNLSAATLDNTDGEIQGKTECNEITIYFYSLSYIENSKDIQMNNKNNCKVVSQNGNKFYSQA